MLYPPNHSCSVSELTGKGRSLVTNVRFSPSDIISDESCFTFALSKEYSEVACTYCGYLCINEAIYGSADSSRYCCMECSQSDSEIHELEMKVMKMLKLAVFESNSARLLVRALITKYLIGDPESLSAPAVGAENNEILGSGVDILQHSVPMDEYLADPADASLIDTLVKIFSILLAMRRKKLGEKGAAFALTISKDDVLNVKYSIQCNAHGVVPRQLEAQEQAVGLALYPHTCMINHDCDPNAVQHFCFERKQPPRLVIRATRTICIGDEVCYNYVPLLQNSAARQELLARNYGFECSCRKCKCHQLNPDSTDSLLISDNLCFLNDSLMDAETGGMSPTELALGRHQCAQLIQESADQLTYGGASQSAIQCGLTETELYPFASRVVEKLDAVLLVSGGATTSPAAGFNPLHSVTFQLHCVYGEACFKSACTELGEDDDVGDALRTLLEAMNKHAIHKLSASIGDGDNLDVWDSEYAALLGQVSALEDGAARVNTLGARFSRAGGFMMLAASYVLGFAGHGRLYCSSCLSTAARALRLVELLGEISRGLTGLKESSVTDDALDASSTEACSSWEQYVEVLNSVGDGAAALSGAPLRGLAALDYAPDARPGAREPGIEGENAVRATAAGDDGLECDRLVRIILCSTAHPSGGKESDQLAVFTGEGFLSSYIHSSSSAIRVLLLGLVQWVLDSQRCELARGNTPFSVKLAMCCVDETVRCRGLKSLQADRMRNELREVIPLPQ